MKDGHVKEAAQGVVEDVPQDVAQDVAKDLAFGAWAARALPVTPLRRRRRLCAARAEMRAQQYLAAQWHLARAVGKRFRGCRAKRLYVDNRRAGRWR